MLTKASLSFWRYRVHHATITISTRTYWWHVISLPQPWFFPLSSQPSSIPQGLSEIKPPLGKYRICILTEGCSYDFASTLKFYKHQTQFQMTFIGRGDVEGKNATNILIPSCFVWSLGHGALAAFISPSVLIFFSQAFCSCCRRATGDRKLGSLPTILSMWE